MHILVVNCGSSSLKAALVDSATGDTRAALRIERIADGDGDAILKMGGATSELKAADHDSALSQALPQLLEAAGVSADAVGHRVVHGGDRFTEPTPIDDEVEAAIEAISPLAPLHNPANVAGIRAARRLLPDVPHVAVFDTAFHSTLPNRARRYAIPQELAEKHGVRRYGFHGPSHQFVARRAAKFLRTDPKDLRIITCHLGNGCSVAAVEYGRSVETSMGMTPLEGLVMGTRAGDIDAGALFHLARAEDLSLDDLDHLLNRKSGLAGLSGVGNDMRDIEERAAEGDERCRAALHAFTHRLRKYIGAYATVMGGVDAIVFTAGIGENSALIRHRVCQRLEFLGARFDEWANREVKLTEKDPVAAISYDRSRVQLLVVATDEQLAIARSVAKVVRAESKVDGPLRPIPIAISARHIHLTQEAVDTLFGEGHQLTPKAPLSQPGQFVCEERLTVVGPRRNLERVAVLGPTRGRCQIEVSRTDEFHLGLDAPIRASGKVANSPGVTLIGPKGQLTLEEGVIQAWRHIHMTPADAEYYGVKNKDVVEIAVTNGQRKMVFGDVLVRVKESYALEMHIDTDEANAADLGRNAVGELVPTQGQAALQRRTSSAPLH